MSTKRVLFLVTHLLGSGHLSRTLTLARAFVAAGHQVRVLSGGMPVPQLSTGEVPLVQLEPLRSDGTDFTRLLGTDGDVAGPELYAKRRDEILTAYTTFNPTHIITELFPFGRRSLRDEFITLLTAARDQRNPPHIFASIRDILAPPSKPKKADFAEEMIARFYDAVLVHSDPSLVPLETSWPVSTELSKKLLYTGFVAPHLPDASAQTEGRGDILVSAGGGAVGDGLFRAAVDAARNDGSRWRLLVSGHDAAERITSLSTQASENVVIEPARPDFRQLLQVARASISLCGYNTAMDVLQSGVPAVMVSYDDGGEVEQTLRARALNGLSRLKTLSLQDIDAENLSAALAAVEDEETPRKTTFGFDGAAKTVEVCISEGAHDD